MRLSRLLRQDMRQADFGLRRFRLRPGAARYVLESAARAFLTGLNAVFHARSADVLVDRLALVDAEHAGFAWEGAGMGAAVLDLVTVSGGRRANIRQLWERQLRERTALVR